MVKGHSSEVEHILGMQKTPRSTPKERRQMGPGKLLPIGVNNTDLDRPIAWFGISLLLMFLQYILVHSTTGCSHFVEV